VLFGIFHTKFESQTEASVSGLEKLGFVVQGNSNIIEIIQENSGDLWRAQ